MTTGWSRDDYVVATCSCDDHVMATCDGHVIATLAADPVLPPVIRPIGGFVDNALPSDRRGISSVALQGPIPGETTSLPPANLSRNPQLSARNDRMGSGSSDRMGHGGASDRGAGANGGSSSSELLPSCSRDDRNVRDDRTNIQPSSDTGRRSPRPGQTGHVMPACEWCGFEPTPFLSRDAMPTPSDAND